MKKFLTLIALSMWGLLVVAQNGTPPCVPIVPAGFTAWWQAEGNANDSVSTNNGTLEGGATFLSGVAGQAFSFDGLSSFVSIPDSPLMKSFTTNLTIELWIKNRQSGNNPDWRGIVTKGNSSWRLQATPGSQTVYLGLSGVGDLFGTRSVNDGQWHHVAATYDGSHMVLYVDGTLDTSQTASGLISQNNDPVCIGRTFGSSYFFNGLADEVALYDRALSASEIQSIYVAGSGGKCISFGAATILIPPTNQIVTVGSNAVLNLTANGTPPLFYHWRFFGTNISDATNSSLAFTNAQLTDAGSYSVVVSNSFGVATSSNAALQVLPPGAPSIQVNGVPAVGTMTFTASVQVSISGGFPSGFIFYTLDGTVPSFSSTLYSGVIELTNSATVQAMSLSLDFSQSAVAPAVNVRIVPLYNLQTSVVGNGTIAANPASSPYLSNSIVTLTATPSGNWLFDHWTGDASGSQNPLSLTINGPHNVQAVFLPIPTYALLTSVTGSGSISLDPPTGPYLSNSVVTLTANGSLDWPFDHWTGDASGSLNPLSVTMNGPRNVQAVFIRNYPITVSTLGGGSITVNGLAIAPATYYPTGTLVTLAATPISGWNFLGWQGDASGTNNPLSVTMNQTNNIQAIFGTVVGTNPLGAGSIMLSLPNPIAFGTTLTASAVPNTGNYFVAWGGAASGTNAPTTITVTSANPIISALFSTLPGGKYALGAVVMGNGSVAISPQKSYYNPGDTVMVSATPVPGASSFYGWTHDASGTNSPLAVVMNTSKIVQANFGALPIVSISPLNLVVQVGSNAVLSATAAGLPPLTYQWQNSQGVIAGATNAIYTLFNVQATNADNYSVIVSNPFGSVTSAVATVTVAFPPSISVQPQGNTVAAGTMVTLGVNAGGTAPLNYQWFDSLGAIPGATNASYILNPAYTNDWNNYFVTVANAYGTVTSAIATLIVYAPVSVTAQPMNQIVPNGAPVSFGVVANGFPAPTAYQWTLNGTNLANATSSSLSLSHVRLADLGYYQALISNGYSFTNSIFATLSMSPSLTTPFSGAIINWGQSVVLSVGAVGSGTLSYQWYLNGVPVGGATNATLSFASIQFTNGGLYSVVVSSPFGVVTNTAAQVIVNPAGIELGFSPTLLISGTVGYSYTIQRSRDLADTNSWVTMENLILTQPVQLWVDTNVDIFTSLSAKHFYRVLPGQ